MTSDQTNNSKAELVRQTVDTAPDMLALQFGIDVDRIRPILKRTVRNQADIISCVNLLKITNTEGVLDIAFHPSLKRALEHLPSDEAIALFETGDLDLLRRNENIVDMMANPYFPLYNLQELVDLTSQFILFLKGVEEQVVATGYAMATFVPSYWLDSNLSNLYFTSTLSEFRTITNWKSAVGLEISSFTDAVVIPIDESNRLIEMRPRLFDMKLAVLRELQSAARHMNPEKMWDRCLAILVDTITAEETDFLFEIDSYYELFHSYTGNLALSQARRRQYMASGGGLTEILQLVGHFEEELTIGTMSHLYNMIGDVINPKSGRYPYGIESSDDKQKSRNYYVTIAQKGREEVDNALAAYLTLEKRARTFRNDYEKRVNSALENELYEEITVRKKVKRKLAHRFELHVQRYADLVGTSLECTGEVPAIQLVLPAHDDGIIAQPSRVNLEEPVFTHSDDYRSVSLRGQSYPLTEMQAAAIRILDEARQRGEEWVNHRRLLAILANSSYFSYKLSDIFRDKSLREALVEKKGKDQYHLNI